MRRPYKVTKQELRSLRLINWVKFNFGKSSLSSDSHTLKHCYFRPLCLPVKKASKTVIRPIRHVRQELMKRPVAYGCHSKINNCLSIFIVYFSVLYIFFVLIDLICLFCFFYFRKGFIFMWIVS